VTTTFGAPSSRPEVGMERRTAAAIRERGS
jgi:hypothetical protein